MHATLDLTVDPTGAGFDPARLDRIDEHLRTRYVDAGKIAGCQVVVARGDTVAHAATIGLADRERGVPVRPDTIWRIYSMTKPVTGVALLTLYEQGKVALKDPVERYLPEFRGARVARARSRRGRPPGRPRAAHDRARPAHAHLGHRLRPAGRAHGPGDARRPPTVGPDVRWWRPAGAGGTPGPRAAPVPPGRPLALLVVDRRRRPGGGGGVGPAVRRVPAGHDLRPARHGRHRLLGAGRRDRPLRRARTGATAPSGWSSATTR